MKRRLLLIRHAKSAWDNESLTDHSRPLAPRGWRDAPRVAAGLLELGWVPERVYSSDALRAVETWEAISRVFPSEIPVEFSGQLYHAGMGAVRRVLTRVPAEVRTVALVGHNPGWEEVASWLSSESLTVKTANAVLLEGEGDTWAEAVAEPGGWYLFGVVKPKE